MNERTRATFEVWFRAAGLVLVATALVAFISGFYSRKFHLETGRASWIWIEHPLDEREPIAFFAVRDVEVPSSPPFVRLRLACDADWTLYLNGEAIAGGEASPAPSLNVLDLTERARKGVANRFVVALRSSTGAGGLLASIDYAPMRENDVATDGSWSICRTWTSGLMTGEVSCDERPLVFGTPPFGRWNYPESIQGKLYSAGATDLIVPIERVDATISTREIRVIDGLAVESSRDMPATRFDFIAIHGRATVSLPEPVEEVTVVEARYAEVPGELERKADNRLFVFAPGESTVADPVARAFRYLAVANVEATVGVIPEPVRPTRP